VDLRAGRAAAFRALLGPHFFLELPDGRIRSGAAAAQALLEEGLDDPVLGAGNAPVIESLGGGYFLVAAAAGGDAGPGGSGGPSASADERAWLFLLDDGLLRGAFPFARAEDAVAAIPAGVLGSRPSQVIERALWAFNSGDFAGLAAMVSTEEPPEHRRGSGYVRDVLARAIANLDRFDDYVIRAESFEDSGTELARVEATIITREGGTEGRHHRWALCRVAGNQICDVWLFDDPAALEAELRLRLADDSSS
jgi:hypothetical protein